MFNLTNSISVLSLYWFNHAFISSFLILLSFSLLVIFGFIILFNGYFSVGLAFDAFELEWLWTFFPLVFIIILGLPIFFYHRSLSGFSESVLIQASQWMFLFDNNFLTSNTIFFTLTSADVIHAWFIPEIWSKLDIVPGQIVTSSSYFPFNGVYRVFCAQICGTSHYLMFNNIYIV